MKMTILGAAAVLVLFAPLAASAADSEASMTAATSNCGVVICGVPKGDEKSNARMVNRSTSLVCKPIDPAGDMSTLATVKAMRPEQLGPDLSRALSPQQIDHAWRRYLDQTFMIDHSS